MRAGSSWRRLAVLAILAAGSAAMIAVGAEITTTGIQQRLREVGIWAPILFVALYAAGTLLFMPGSVLSLAGGALFGPIWGVVINLSGATLGATLAFLTGRYLAGDLVARWSGPRLQRLLTGVEAEGWRFVALVRLVPLVPFNVLNYALGLARIPMLASAAASFVCMIPGAIVYTWAGHAGRDIATRGGGALPQALTAIGLLTAMAFVARLVRRWRRPAAVGGLPGDLTGTG
jgi:uncharacterized membrane protein YdjX (TVP38/TMEM64 family)